MSLDLGDKVILGSTAFFAATAMFYGQSLFSATNYWDNALKNTRSDTTLNQFEEIYKKRRMVGRTYQMLFYVSALYSVYIGARELVSFFSKRFKD